MKLVKSIFFSLSHKNSLARIRHHLPQGQIMFGDFFLQGCGGRCLPQINEEKNIFEHFSYRECQWLATVLHFKVLFSLLVEYPPAKYSPCNIAALTFRDLILNSKMQDFFISIFIVIHSKYWIKWKHKLRTRQSALLRELRHVSLKAESLICP